MLLRVSNSHHGPETLASAEQSISMPVSPRLRIFAFYPHFASHTCKAWLPVSINIKPLQGSHSFGTSHSGYPWGTPRSGRMPQKSNREALLEVLEAAGVVGRPSTPERTRCGIPGTCMPAFSNFRKAHMLSRLEHGWRCCGQQTQHHHHNRHHHHHRHLIIIVIVIIDTNTASYSSYPYPHAPPRHSFCFVYYLLKQPHALQTIRKATTGK